MSTDLYYSGRRIFETNPYGIQYYWDEASRTASTTSASYASSATSDSAVSIAHKLKSYADIFADRMYEDNLEDIDRDYIAGLIYAILMQDNVDEVTKNRLLDDRPGNLFKDEDFEL